MSAVEDSWSLMHGEDPRMDPRANVFLMAVLCSKSAETAVRIRNLSPHGALLEGANLPEQSVHVEIKRGSISACGTLAWSKDLHCGIRFEQPIRVSEWIEKAGPVGQQRIDAAIAEFRRRPSAPTNLAVLGNGPAPDSLERLTAQLLQTCERMAGLPGMSVRLGEELLRIEASARAIEAIAKGPGR